MEKEIEVNGTTGAWEEKVIDAVTHNTEIVAAVVMFICLCGAALSIRYIWVQLFHDTYIKLWNKVIRNPISWLVRPIRRAHSRYSAKKLRAKMAKWKREIVANIFYDGLSKACDEQLISKHDKRRLMKKMAEFFDVPDLRRPNNHLEAIKLRIKENTSHEASPAQEKPAWGGKPGEDTVPRYEQLGAKFLNRKKVA